MKEDINPSVKNMLVSVMVGYELGSFQVGSKAKSDKAKINSLHSASQPHVKLADHETQIQIFV